MSKTRRSASAAPVAYKGRITSEDLDISCPHNHATQDNAHDCSRLALKYLRYRETLGVTDPTPEIWMPSMDRVSAARDIEPDTMLKELEGRLGEKAESEGRV